MLPPKLQALQNYLDSLSDRDAEQDELLIELNFLDSDAIITEQIKKKAPKRWVNESFATAPTLCPVCGKRL